MVLNSKVCFSIFITLAFLITTGCEKKEDFGQQQIKDTVHQYFTSIQKGDYKQAVQEYSIEQRDKWLQYLQEKRSVVGAMNSFSVKGIEVNTVYSGKIIVVRVVTDNQIRGTTDLVTLFKKVSEETYYLQSHNIKLHKIREK